MKKVLFILVLIALFSCEKLDKKIDVKTDKKEKLVMYEPSEMTVLMRDLILYQKEVKKGILNNEIPKALPKKYEDMHKAILSDDFERDASFESFTKLFFANAEKVSNAKSPAEAKQHFNTMVNSCIACHETTCHGPIVRIEKLIIR